MLIQYSLPAVDAIVAQTTGDYLYCTAQTRLIGARGIHASDRAL
ncbi:MAG: hypothetical protein ACRESK_04225 [Gammaproteobacteria bacterium]